MAKKSKKYPGVYIIQGKKGVSYGIDYIHPQTGQRVRKILKNAASETQAFELRSIELADAARGAVNKAYGLKEKGRAILFSDGLDQYLKWSKENKKSWMTDEYNAKPLQRAFKSKLMSEINPFLIEKYKMARAKEVAKSTVNNEISLGSQVFEKAIEWEKYEGKNPFWGAKFKRRKQKKPGCLTLDEVQAIIDEVGHPVKKDMIEFDFNTGWRISEIRKLKWEDVDLEHGRAWIVDPKNGRPVEIELNDEAIAVISRQERRGPFVFCYKNGQPFKTNLHAAIKNAANRAGVYLPPRKAWHIFRRTWASNFLQSGGDVETLRVLGNWRDYSMPLWYADAAGSEHKRKLLNKLPKLGNGRNLAEMGKVVVLSGGNK